jgi:hypothetical protein
MNITMRSPWESRYFRCFVSVLIIGVLFAAVLLPLWAMSVYAFEQTSSCVDSTTLLEVVNITGSPVESYTPCDYGCDVNMGQCKPHPLMQYAIFGGFIIFIIGIFRLINKHA